MAAAAAAAGHVLIPAGGAGSRLGGQKPTTLLAGRPLLEHALDAVLAARLRPLVVARAETQLPQSELLARATVIHDTLETVHPFSGVIAGLEHLEEPCVVLAGDMPFVPPELLSWLAAQSEPLVTCDRQGVSQPLLARYEPRQLPALRAAVEQSRSARRTLGQLGLRELSAAELTRFGEPGEIFFDVDDPADLAAAEARLAGGVA